MGASTGSRALMAKVCGLTRPEDVAAAVSCGADLAGFVSYPRSPRHLGDAELVALSTPLQGGATRGVMVTVDRSRAEVDRVMERATLAAVQLCGTEDPADWSGAGYSILRRVAADDGALTEIARWDGVAESFVLDHPATPGGSGLRVDVDHVLPALAAARCLLAGGLTPELLEAGLDPRLLTSGLVGVDASSGLEVEPGRKSADSIRRFVAAAHRTHAVAPR